MKVAKLCLIFSVVVLCFCAINLMGGDPSQKEHGTLVFRGELAALWFMWGGEWEDEQAVLMVSDDPDWLEKGFCADDWSGIARYHEVWLPIEKDNFFYKGPFAARLFYPIRPAQLIAAFESNPCEWLKNQPTELIVAEGIVQFTYSESNVCAWGHGQNQWYWRLGGSLINLTGDCPAKRIAVSYEEHYRLKPHAVVVDCYLQDASDLVLINWALHTSCIP
jgi:hypothetical protein